ncbi:WxcM-like domain-containing protein [Parvibaculum sp.]|uniref:sugar 3,4-ketoisomerase n=1 Tax=Parvibaculum sp. TaxID=2024848 RepID=UPI00321131BE
MIDQSAFIDPTSTLSPSATIGPLAYVGPGAVVGDSVVIGPGAQILSDSDRPTIIKPWAVIGGGSTVTAGVEIGTYARIGSGVVVAENVPPNMILSAPRPRVLGYGEGSGQPVARRHFSRDSKLDAPTKIGVGAGELWPVPVFSDLRGSLSAIELSTNLPFRPERIFLIYGVPSEEMRGDHAHRRCAQFLVAVHGSVSLILDDGERSVEVRLNRPNLGVYMPPMIWGTQYNYSSDAVLMVFASHSYDPSDYIRSYDQFKAILASQETTR